MQVIITGSTFAAGVPLTASPKPIELDDAVAKALIAANKAVPAADDGGRNTEVGGTPSIRKSKAGGTPAVRKSTAGGTPAVRSWWKRRGK